MGIFPHAPKVEIFAPTTLFVGQPTSVEIVITANEPTKVDFVEARVIGHQGWSVGSGKNRITFRAKFPELATRLMDQGVLQAGTVRFTNRFTLPPGTPPTHQRDPAWANLELFVRVSIPWWPDGKYRFVLPVRLTPDPVVRTPIAIRSTPADAPAGKPRLEVSLASSCLIAGEAVVGSCAVFHLDDRKPRELDLTLVPTLLLHGRGRRRERRGQTINATITVPAGSAGTSIPFKLQLPETMTPSFETVSHKLSWWLSVTSGSFFSKKVELAIPLEIVDASAHATTEQLTIAPRLADERVANTFAQFASARSWSLVDAPEDGDHVQPSIERAAGDNELHLAYSYRGKDGTFLVARVTHPPLGLGVSVTPSSALRQIFFEDVEVDIAEWDRAHHVSTRSPAQTIPMLRAVVPALMATSSLGTLVRWNDDELVFERPVVSVEANELAKMESELQRVAAAIGEAGKTIAPPPDVNVDVEAWQALARWLHGRLTVGDLSIDGHLDNVPVALGLEWNEHGQPSGVHVSVGDPEAASAAARELSLSLARPAADALAEPLAERFIEQLVKWPSDVVHLRVVDGVASASWSSGSALDATRVRELVEALRALLAAIDPSAGPYR